jgi:hypothetical protein
LIFQLSHSKALPSESRRGSLRVENKIAKSEKSSGLEINVHKNHVPTTKSPQTHHNSPSKNTVENAKPPVKTPLHHAKKKLSQNPGINPGS